MDNSGSTNERFHGDLSGPSIWELSHNALQRGLSDIAAEGDRISLSEFNHRPKRLGEATGSNIAELTRMLRPSNNGTEIGAAISSANAEWATDIVLITDGRSHALDVHALASRGKRVSVVLCGQNSLEAHVGHLAALTGGIIVVAGSDNIDAPIKTVLRSLRTPVASPESSSLKSLPDAFTSLRGGAEIKIAISGKDEKVAQADAVGAYAAFLALPLLEKNTAAEIAAANGLCTHLTSLVVVDEVGEAREGLPNQRKIPLSAPIEAMMFGMASSGPSMIAKGSPQLMASAASNSSYDFFSQDKGCSAPTSNQPSRFLRSMKPFDGFGARTEVSSPAPLPDNMLAGLNLAAIAQGIAWGSHAAELACGNTDALDDAAKRAIAIAAADKQIIALAAKLSVSATLLVIAILAKKASTDRNAARISRLILSKADNALIENAMTAIHL